IRPVATPADFAAYYERAQRVVDALDVILQRLHDAGYAFIDVNPHNVLVDDDDRPRLVDFEAAGPLDGPLEPIGAPGYFAAADLDRADRVFPIGPSGYLTNALCVAHGLAGILHALRRCGATPPDGTVAHLATRSLARLDELPPGLHVGTAGIAWVLADHGCLDEAQALLDNADRHPALESSATLGHGRAGVALAELALYRYTGDERFLDRALTQADRI